MQPMQPDMALLYDDVVNASFWPLLLTNRSPSLLATSLASSPSPSLSSSPSSLLSLSLNTVLDSGGNGEDTGGLDFGSELNLEALPLEQMLWFQQNISKEYNMSLENMTSWLVNNGTVHTMRDPMSLVITLTFFYALISVAGLLGNLITCIVISRNKFMHTATNFYLFNLAVSDLILLLSGMPQELYNLWCPGSYPFTDILCVMESILSETAANATVLTITAFTVERYIAICHPFRQHTMSKLSRAIKFIFAIWVMAFLLALPQAMQFSVEENGTLCTIGNNFYAHVFAVSGFIFFGGPMTAICVLYVLIGVKLKRSRLLQAVPRRCFDVNRGISAQTRVIRMLVAVAVAFFICWAPFHAQRLMAAYGSTNKMSSEIFNEIYIILNYTSGVLYFLSTCINPLLYNIMSHKFRDAFKVTLARHFGLAGTYQTRNRNYSALLRQNGSMRLHTTVNNNALEHFNSYRIVQLHCRDPSHHLSLQDSIRTTTTTTTINSSAGPVQHGSSAQHIISNSAGGGLAAKQQQSAIGGMAGNRSSAHRNRCISIGSQSTLMTSLSKSDMFAGKEGLPHRILQSQISQLSSVGDANSLMEADIGAGHYHHHGPLPTNASYRLKDLQRLKMGSRSSRAKCTADDCLGYDPHHQWEDSLVGKHHEELASHHETELITKPVAPIAPVAAHIMELGNTSSAVAVAVAVQPMHSIAELNINPPSRSRLKLSRIISRRDQDALVANSGARVELMRAQPLSGYNECGAAPLTNWKAQSSASNSLNRDFSQRSNSKSKSQSQSQSPSLSQPNRTAGKTLDNLVEKFRWKTRRKMANSSGFHREMATPTATRRLRQESSSSSSSTSTPTATTTLMRLMYPTITAADGNDLTTTNQSELPLHHEIGTLTPEAL